MAARQILDNADFRSGCVVNQRNVSGTFADVGQYFIDRWILVSGTVTITANGLTLNGTMRQKLEYPDGTNTCASVEMHSGEGAAIYNNNASPYATFDITSNGGTVRRAKLEVGTISTLHADPPMDHGAELIKCCGYQFVYDEVTTSVGLLRAAEIPKTGSWNNRRVVAVMPTPVPLRIKEPVITILPGGFLRIMSFGSTIEETGFTFNAVTHGCSVQIYGIKTSHNLTDATFNLVRILLDANL